MNKLRQGDRNARLRVVFENPPPIIRREGVEIGRQGVKIGREGENKVICHDEKEGSEAKNKVLPVGKGRGGAGIESWDVG